MVTQYLKMEKLNDGTAESIFSAYLSVMEKYHKAPEDCFSQGSDGASVMTGCENGVSAKQKETNPYSVNPHCINHRLNLAISQIAKTLEKQENFQHKRDLEAAQTTMSTVYQFIQLSSTHLQKFKDMSELLEIEIVKFRTIFDIRWLSYGDGVRALIRNLLPLFATLEIEADYGNPTAIGLLNQLTSYKHCALLHLMADIHGIIDHLSRVFQHRDVCFSVVRDKACICVLLINSIPVFMKPPPRRGVNDMRTCLSDITDTIKLSLYTF